MVFVRRQASKTGVLDEKKPRQRQSYGIGVGDTVSRTEAMITISSGFLLESFLNKEQKQEMGGVK